MRIGGAERGSMLVSIRDNIAATLGADNLAEACRLVGVEAVEWHCDRNGTVASLNDSTAPRIPLTTPDGLRAAREDRARAGLAVPALLLATDFNNDDPAGERDWVVGAAEAAAALGVPALRIDAAMSGERDLPLAERQDRFAAAMREIVGRTAGLPVVFGIENHGIQGNDPEFLEGLMDRVGSTRMGMTLDTGNFYWPGHPLETVYEILARLAQRTVHTHVKNIAYPPEWRHRTRSAGWEYGRHVCPIQSGDIDHARVVALLARAGYTGDLCIEDESLDRFPVDVRVEHIRGAAEHLRDCIAAARGNQPPSGSV